MWDKGVAGVAGVADEPPRLIGGDQRCGTKTGDRVTPARVTPSGRHLCPYCLGVYAPRRRDAVYCSGPCRTAACRAIALESYAYVESPLVREESHAPERRAATGWGLLTRRECYLADLRVRALHGERLEHRDQWAAWLEWARRLGARGPDDGRTRDYPMIPLTDQGYRSGPRSMGYDDAAEWFGVYVREYVDVLGPRMMEIERHEREEGR
jgi:hypothetical protein